jgi:NAD(P)-dependent dehydrogenase (short-subunit alcohol dehydrogenase family)
MIRSIKSVTENANYGLEGYTMRMKDRVVIVAGSAMGIGKATVHRFATEGAKVVAADISLDGANKVIHEIRELGHDGMAVKVDVTKLEDAKQMSETVLAKLGQIDVLLNVAGGAVGEKIGPFGQSDKDGWDKTIALNLYGTFNCTRAIINHMIDRRKGKIVNMASQAGILGQGGTADYAACKGGIIAFTKSPAKEVAPYGITVNCVSPGIIGTERVLGFPEAFKKNVLQHVHLGRLGTPEDVANVLFFLASEDADYITGQNYSVDGGTTLGYKS